MRINKQVCALSVCSICLCKSAHLQHWGVLWNAYFSWSRDKWRNDRGLRKQLCPWSGFNCHQKILLLTSNTTAKRDHGYLRERRKFIYWHKQSRETNKILKAWSELKNSWFYLKLFLKHVFPVSLSFLCRVTDKSGMVGLHWTCQNWWLFKEISVLCRHNFNECDALIPPLSCDCIFCLKCDLIYSV